MMENSITTQKPKKAQVSREELMSRLPIPGPGRPKETEEQKIAKKAVKQLLKEYEQGLADALPEIQPALIEQAKRGNIPAVTEIHKVLGAHKNTNNTIVPIQININEERATYDA